MNFEKLLNESKALTASTGVTRPKLDAEGRYTVKVVESSYGPNQSKTGFRGQLKLEVVDGEKATALTNAYIAISDNDERNAQNINPYYKTLLASGINKDKIFDDASDWQDVVQNITTQYTKLIKNGKNPLFTLVLKANKNKEGEFYKNVYIYEAPASDAPSITSTVVESEIKADKPAKAKKVIEPTNASVTKLAEPDLGTDDESWLD